MKIKKIIIAMASAGLLAAAGNVAALVLSAPVTQSFTVTVSSTCTVQAPGAVVFPALATGATPGASGTQTGNAVVTCASASKLGIDAGLHSVGAQRNMAGPSGSLYAYDIKTGTTPVGTGGIVTSGIGIPFATAAAFPVSAPGTGTTTTVPISGVLSATAPTIPGTYSDTVNYYVEF